MVLTVLILVVMGNSHTKTTIEKTPIYEVIKEEFMSVGKGQNIPYHELIHFKIPKNFQGDIDLTRIETIFILDHDKDGQVSLEDLTNFCVVFSNTTGPDWDLANRFNTTCATQFSRAIACEGPVKISNWIISLVAGDTPTIPQESVMLLYRLFAPLLGETMDSLKFFRLLRQRANDNTVDREILINHFLVSFLSCYQSFHKVDNS